MLFEVTHTRSRMNVRAMGIRAWRPYDAERPIEQQVNAVSAHAYGSKYGFDQPIAIEYLGELVDGVHIARLV